MRRTPFLSAHFGLFLLGLVGLVTFIDAESAVYRGHDKEGNIIYSDRPFEGAKEISPPAATRYSPPETPKKPATEAKNTPEPAPVADKNVSYRTISIAQPKNDENIHENGGNLAVTVELSPSL
ncbi:MAG: hypothetical protein OEW08_06115, partial [Gammaproteobacteria bacterium]|nr:hypothetical protein [Gammaproteobacteria bacterium]